MSTPIEFFNDYLVLLGAANAEDRAGEAETTAYSLGGRAGAGAGRHAAVGRVEVAIASAKRVAVAAEAGRALADDFPDNREVAAFLETREVRAAR